MVLQRPPEHVHTHLTETQGCSCNYSFCEFSPLMLQTKETHTHTHARAHTHTHTHTHININTPELHEMPTLSSHHCCMQTKNVQFDTRIEGERGIIDITKRKRHKKNTLTKIINI